MLKGKTKSGFSYQISDERLNNYELLEMIGDIEDNPILVGKVVKLMLGPELAKALKEHVRNADGIVPADKMMSELNDITSSQAKLKKS